MKNVCHIFPSSRIPGGAFAKKHPLDPRKRTCQLYYIVLRLFQESLLIRRFVFRNLELLRKSTPWTPENEPANCIISFEDCSKSRYLFVVLCFVIWSFCEKAPLTIENIAVHCIVSFEETIPPEPPEGGISRFGQRFTV